MKIKNKLILTLSLILMILLAAEVILGEFYFEKYFRYSKMKELENINFIVNNKINYDLLKKYQKDILSYLDLKHPEIGKEIEEKKDLSDELIAKIIEAAKEYTDK